MIARLFGMSVRRMSLALLFETRPLWLSKSSTFDYHGEVGTISLDLDLTVYKYSAKSIKTKFLQHSIPEQLFTKIFPNLKDILRTI